MIRWPWIAVLLLLTWDLHGAPREEGDLLPGIVGTYFSNDGNAYFQRIDEAISFDWSDGGTPDPRLNPGGFRVLWEGALFVDATGTYRFYAHVKGGRFSLWLNGRPVLRVTSTRPTWHVSKPIELKSGLIDIEAAFHTSGAGAVTLCWESERFLLEPLSSRQLLHSRPQVASRDELYRRGRLLVRALRCAACHELPEDASPLPAPALDHSLQGVSRSWLAAWLQNPRALKPSTPMPGFGMTPDEANLLASFLLSRAENRLPPSPRGGGNAENGRKLFISRGCAGCHTAAGVGRDTLFGGGALDSVGWKRSADSLHALLMNPRALNPDARMPSPMLSATDRRDLVAYLRTLRRGAETAAPTDRAAPTDNTLAARLVDTFACAACHRMEGFGPPERTRLGALSHIRLKGTCLGEPAPDASRPGYQLADGDIKAVLFYLEQTRVAAHAQVAASERGRQRYAESNCAGCHRRNGTGGYVGALNLSDLQALGVSEALRRGELSPPDLTSAGDKFHETYLRDAVQGRQSARRPWLEIRMPQFVHSEQTIEELIAYLVSSDGVPDPLPDSRLRRTVELASELNRGDAVLAARQIVSSRGFGCMSCHAIKGIQPRGADPEARGPDLAGIPEIERAPWFMRWVRDPTRISLGVEMPAVQVAVPAVLDGNLDKQLAALWTAFRSDEFRPPEETSVVVQTLSPLREGRAIILRDCIRDAPSGSGWCPRSFAVGFPGGLNVLIDLDSYTVRALWAGDLAHEKTERKTWLWEPAGQQAWLGLPSMPSLVLASEDGWLLPEKRWQSVGRLLWWEHVDATTVRFAYRVFFRTHDVAVIETWHEPARGERSVPVLERMIEVDGGKGNRFAVALDVPGAQPNGDGGLVADSGLGPLQLSADSDITRVQLGDRSVPVVALRPDQGKRLVARISYCVPELTAELLRPSTAALSGEMSSSAAILPWVPGYRTVRFPLPRSVLPVSIAFLPNGEPVVGSLRGGVYVTMDSDGDGLYDRWRRYSDMLAAPFGLYVEETGIVVSHKPELVRLIDRDGDGFAERTEVIATGWGYTHDYHDWTFGIVKDRSGRYIVTLGSDYQQKGRPRESSRFRGHALAISPDGAIEDIARGLRFPVGLAANREGEIFFTDNQGVQNTFNELNHLVPYSRYGVPALYDPPPEQDPWPERYPAIQIPHPWTRSVNGICFLRTASFGQHTWHGVGCEYDTRRLIRFTLYRAGDEYRGACYPLSLHPESDRERMLRLWRETVARGPESLQGLTAARPSDLVPLGPIACAVRDDGRLFVGSIRESGWGGGQNVGELLMLEPTGQLPPGLLEAAFRDGRLYLRFTVPVDEEAARNPRSYEIQSYRRVWAGAYATPDSDRRRERIHGISVLDGGEAVLLNVGEIRPGFVYEIRVSPTVLGAAELWPGEAYVTAPGEPPGNGNGRPERKVSAVDSKRSR